MKSRRQNWVAWAGTRLADLVLPINCFGCQTEGAWLCPTCFSALARNRSDRCTLCGKAAEDGLCRPCRQFSHLDGLVSLFSYHEPALRSLIKAVKFAGYAEAFVFLTDRLSREFRRRLPEDNELTIVPLPLSKERLRQRGFNQAEVIAGQLSRRLELESVSCLSRIRPTAAQAELKRASRLKNVRNAFVATAPPERVLLVDDVVTTGATLRDAARALRKKGAKTVWALTLSHG